MADSPEIETSTEIDEGVAQIAEGLFDTAPQQDDGEELELETGTENEAPPAQEESADPAAVEEQATPAVTTKAPPKSWAADKHELWGKLPPEAQDYYEQREKQMLDGLEQYKENSGFGRQLRDVFTPYRALLQAQGVDEVKATQYMLNAHYRLSSGSPQQKAEYMSQLAKSYGIDLAMLAPQQEEAQVDPTVRALQEKVGSLESVLTTQQQREQQSLQDKIRADIEAFASDPKNVYFDECADDIAALIQAGNTLETAYEKAVYANPVTRAKEIARLQTEHEKSLREKAEREVAAARSAKSTNVRGRDTRRTPTEPKGTMDDTLAATLKEIKERVH